MKVRDDKGRILTSNNPVITGMWKKAGYKEIGAAKEESDRNARRSRKKE